jgi:hypothetical protein
MQPNTDDDSEDGGDGDITQKPRLCALYISYVTTNFIVEKKIRASLGNPRQTDEHGFLADIQVQPIDKKRCTRKEKTTDIEHFFHPAAVQDIDSNGGEPQKTRRCCKLCP